MSRLMKLDRSRFLSGPLESKSYLQLKIFQAMLLGKYLSKDGFTRIISSGLLRANETAEAIISSSASGPLNLEIDERIRERVCSMHHLVGTLLNWSSRSSPPNINCEFAKPHKNPIPQKSPNHTPDPLSFHTGTKHTTKKSYRPKIIKPRSKG